MLQLFMSKVEVIQAKHRQGNGQGAASMQVSDKSQFGFYSGLVSRAG